MSRVRKALGVSFVGRYVNGGLQLIGTVTLARLLSPHDIGIYSIATVFMGMVQTFRDMGIGQYLVQERQLTEDKLRSTLGGVSCTSTALATGLYFAADSIANFYREPGLAEILKVLVINLLLIPFGFLVQSHLRRQLAFVRLQIIRVGSTACQVATSIVLASLEFGFMSLAWGSVVGVLVTVLLANLFRPRHLFILPSFRQMGRVFRYGSRAVPMSLVGELSAGLPEMVLGRTLGMAPVAVYSRAVGQVGMFNRLFGQTLGEVGLPYFAQLNRNGRSLQVAYRKASERVQGIAWPLFAFLGLMAFPLVRLLYGDQWLASAALIPVLCVGASVGMMLPLSQEILVGSGRINTALIQVILQTVLSAGVLILCSPFGLTVVVRIGVGTAVVMTFVRYFLLRGWAVEKDVLFSMALRSGAVTATTAAGPLLVYMGLGQDSVEPLLAVGLAAVLAAPGWLIGLAWTGHPLAQEVARLAQRMVPRAPVGWLLRRVTVEG